MENREVLVLTAPKLAMYLRAIADKLDRVGRFELEYHDNFYWEFAEGVATNFETDPSRSQFHVASATDTGDYFLTGFDPDDDIMLPADLWKLAAMLRYYDLSLGHIGEANGN